MLRKIRRNRPGILGGALMYLVLVAFQLLAPREWLAIIRERGYDAALCLSRKATVEAGSSALNGETWEQAP